MRTPSMMFLAAAALPGALASSENSEEFEKLTVSVVSCLHEAHELSAGGTSRRVAPST